MSLTERQQQAQNAGQAAMRRYAGRDGYFMAVFDIANAVAALWQAEADTLTEQLAAERAAREAEQHAASAAITHAMTAAGEARATMAERDQQLAGATIRRDNAESQLRRLGDAMSDLETELADAYRRLEAAETTIAALLAPPAAVDDPEHQRFEAHMDRVLHKPPAAVEAVEPDSEPCLCVHQKRHHYPDSCCFATDQIGPYAERCGCRKFEPRPAAQQQPGDAAP